MTFRPLLLAVCALALIGPAAGVDSGGKLFEAAPVTQPGCEIDRLVLARLGPMGIRPTLCSDQVFVRRLYLDLTGTLPTAEQARTFIEDPDQANKRLRLIDALLGSTAFDRYWAMKWGDILRIKAEFPVNLWPNAAQAYHRWVLASLAENKPYDQFARELLTSSGSNFRVGPVNFYRAMQDKSPGGIAATVALTLMGSRTDKWPPERTDNLTAFFSQVGYKPTREWKEEIVFWDPLAAKEWDTYYAALAEAAKPPPPPAKKPAAKKPASKKPAAKPAKKPAPKSTKPAPKPAGKPTTPPAKKAPAKPAPKPAAKSPSKTEGSLIKDRDRSGRASPSAFKPGDFPRTQTSAREAVPLRSVISKRQSAKPAPTPGVKTIATTPPKPTPKPAPAQDANKKTQPSAKPVAKKPAKPAPKPAVDKPAVKPTPPPPVRPTPQPLGRVTFPDGTSVQISPDQDPREVFADWLIRPENPWFTRNIANRVWSWLLGRGIIHEPDDIRPGNPPANPELLAYLEKELVASGYDLKQLYRLILNSKVYQFSSTTEVDNPQAVANFAAYPVRRLEAEVLIDALNKITGTTDLYTSPIPEPFTYIPEDMPATAIADGSITSPFLALFGRSARASGMENERSNELQASQWLHMLNSTHVQTKLERGPALKALLSSGRKFPAIVEELYLTILSRSPTLEEVKMIEAYGKPGQYKRREDWNDIVWALVNSTEFLFRH